jgi:peptidoglycan-N-acetylglucosamine deacetylase
LDETHERVHEHSIASGKPKRRWRPAPILWLSLVVHGFALIVLTVQPHLWRWVAGSIIGNHLLLCVAVLFPRASWLGSNLTRLPEVNRRRNEIALTFDDGPDPEVTPRVLELLERHNVKASFFCIGAKAAAFPDLVREIVRRGHSVENHSNRHPHTFSLYGLRRLAHEVDSAQSCIAGITGLAPRFFRAPAGFRSPLLDPILAWRGLRYMSWTRRGFDAVARDPALVLRLLTRNLSAGEIVLLHDGAGTRSEANEPLVLSVLPRLLEVITAKGLHPVSLYDAFPDPYPIGSASSVLHTARRNDRVLP